MSYRHGIHLSFSSHGSPSFCDCAVVVVAADQVDTYVEPSSLCLGESNKQFHLKELRNLLISVLVYKSEKIKQREKENGR